MRPRVTLQRVLVSVLLTEAAVLLGLLCYLAWTEHVLLVEITARDRIVRASAGPYPLLIPVAGVRAAELRDTYGASRSGGRSHQGIDIPAPVGTPVLAAATGVIVGLESSARGGISVYQRDLDARTIYFYGHLQRYRAALKPGDLVRQGEVVAYVGETGNTPPGLPHLHFSVYTVPAPNRWWRGRNLNPCDLLPCGATEAKRAP